MLHQVNMIEKNKFKPGSEMLKKLLIEELSKDELVMLVEKFTHGFGTNSNAPYLEANLINIDMNDLKIKFNIEIEGLGVENYLEKIRTAFETI